MHFRSILSGTLALLLVSGAAVAAQHDGGLLERMPGAGLPGVFETRTDEIRVAQVSDPRVMQLEEQIRSLNGKLEELNFQILQMQEQMRKMQEDNEFRLQELEKKAGNAGGSKNRNVAESPSAKPADRAGATAGGAPATTTNDTSLAELPPADAGGSSASGGASGTVKTGEAPRNFGTITVDKDGNVTSSTTDPVDLLPQANGNNPSAGVDVAALPKTDDPEELYRNSYQFVLSGDYANAEAGFRDHIAHFPSDAKAADSNYWLGESLLGQQKYSQAAEVFLAAGKNYPKAKKAPDMLLKLGVSLAGMNQKDVACATFAEVGKRFPNAPDALKQRVKQEQALAAC
ncbi:tol-pal system protein YbgF [Arvimicrobium flavum]|uniref:tol-pal system protein YbgF n=1 Tax=Arvimicrobium flavum TaxID=3393320 RepID=UPI00237C271A|nr:tol-pal system protein YbgF [Mesorhizobium shangrilense]